MKWLSHEENDTEEDRGGEMQSQNLRNLRTGRGSGGDGAKHKEEGGKGTDTSVVEVSVET